MRHSLIITALLAVAFAVPAQAADMPFSTLQQSVLIECGSLRGSGAITNVQKGYVITAGHLVIDPTTGAKTTTCQVDVIDESLHPKAAYAAEVVRAVFDSRKDLDFAVLHITGHSGGTSAFPASPMLVDHRARIGDAVTIIGFPGSSGSAQTLSSGTVNGFSRGYVVTDAKISQGSSGSPAVDAQGRMIGVASRVSFITDSTGTQKIVDYRLGDVLSLVTWLDDGTLGAYREYFSMADPSFDAASYVSRDEQPGCNDVARTVDSDAVYCLLADSRRFVFPNLGVYSSWYPDFTNVVHVAPADLAAFRLTGNMTYRAGTLVKIQTDPKVYVVTDSIGTIRWVQTEERAIQLFGNDWAKKVRDVPDAFFVDYTVGPPVP